MIFEKNNFSEHYETGLKGRNWQNQLILAEFMILRDFLFVFMFWNLSDTQNRKSSPLGGEDRLCQ